MIEPKGQDQGQGQGQGCHMIAMWHVLVWQAYYAGSKRLKSGLGTVYVGRMEIAISPRQHMLPKSRKPKVTKDPAYYTMGCRIRWTRSQVQANTLRQCLEKNHAFMRDNQTVRFCRGLPLSQD